MISTVEATAPRQAERAIGGVGAVIHELVSLLELQVELFRLDLRESTKRLMIGFGLLAAAAALAVAFFCVLLIFAAVALIQGNVLGSIAAFAVVTLLGLIVTVAFGYFGWRFLSRGVSVFQRSGEEFGRTVRSIKQLARGRATE